jgi:hypothetical protein
MTLLPPTMPNFEHLTTTKLRVVLTDTRLAIDEALKKLRGRCQTTVVTDEIATARLLWAKDCAENFCIYTAACRELASRGHKLRAWRNLGWAVTYEEWYLKVIKEGNRIASEQFLSGCGIAPI